MSRKNRRYSTGTTAGTSADALGVYHPKTKSEFEQIHRDLSNRRYVAIDILKGKVADMPIPDGASKGAADMAAVMGSGDFCNGPLTKVARSFDGRENTIVRPSGKDGKPLGNGYVMWGERDNIPSVIPPLAMSSPYTAAPLTYIADLTGGLGPRLYYRTDDGELVEYKDAGKKLQDRVDELEEEKEAKQQNADGGLQLRTIIPDPQDPAEQSQSQQQPTSRIDRQLQRAREKLQKWENTWNGFDVPDNPDAPKEQQTFTHIPGAKQFIDENNMDMHCAQWAQDNVMLNMAFPTIGLQRGRSRRWDYPVKPRIIRTDVLPAHSCRLEVMNENRYIHHVYFSDSLRTKGATGVTVTTAGATATADNSFKMYPCAMPQHLLSEINYIVESNIKTKIKSRPTWICCPTYYPSGQKPYYPQPAWWSIFTSKAFDFSATILYDKYKQRENNTTWGRIIYISLDYLDQVFADEGYQGDKAKQQEFIDQLDQSVEQFLQHRENNGKMMRQFMWTGQDGKEHKNVEVVDVKETTNDAVKAGKEELELSTSPIFLALQVDPRLVGVPMVAASNGGTALREMQLLKQQMLSFHQRNYCRFLDAIANYNEWYRAEWHIKQQTLTTLDNSKTGVIETISGEQDKKAS
ncbi:MAG: hypothetical protein ACOCNX_01115 [Prevotella sp.]